MNRKSTVLILAVLIGLVGACTKETTDPAEEAWDGLVEAWDGLETAEQKAAIAEDYLSKYPDTEHSGSMAGAIVYYRGHEMEDPRGAYEAVAPALGQIADPGQRFEVSMELLSLADSVEVPLELGVVARSLAGERALTYSEHRQIFETAVDLEEWDIASEYAGAAVALATPESFRAEYPDWELSDEELTDRANGRKASALAYDGWAIYNMGDPDLAFARFTAANEIGSVSYLGVPNTPLYTFWGRAALSEGDLEKAIELLGAETAFGGYGSSAESYLREAYAARNGDEEGFDEFLWKTRNRLAKTVDEFTLNDYEGNPVSLKNISTDKVTLLAFWFPT